MAVSGSSSRRMTELELNKFRRDQHRDVSRGRVKVWTEPANRKSKSDHRVPVVYYLCRNGQLEHPHFMEVPLSSPNGLFLRDVIGRLNDLRGKGMSGMYSWSCKRSYKNGYVWHDLSENDFIYPTHRQDYVLKGSELLQDPPPENRITTTASEAGYRRRDSSTDSNSHEHSVYEPKPSFRSASNASAQTDDGPRRRRRSAAEIVAEKKAPSAEVRDEIEISPPASDSSVETLATLLKADGRLIVQPKKKESRPRKNSDRQLIQKANKSSVLMQLISCGSSLSFKGSGPGQVISRYRMRVRGGGGGGGKVKVEEKGYFSESMVETKKKELNSRG